MDSDRGVIALILRVCFFESYVSRNPLHPACSPHHLYRVAHDHPRRPVFLQVPHAPMDGQRHRQPFAPKNSTPR